MDRYTDVIWDFNGTILNDMAACIDSVNPMLSERGLSTIANIEEYRTLFDFPIEAYYKRLGFDFEKEPFRTVLAPMWVENYLRESRASPIFDGVFPLAKKLRAAGLRQSILSATEKDMLLLQLRERGALSLFDEVWGCDNIHAYGKEGLALSWRAAHKEARALLLGDTTHDAAVARAIGADCILIAAGHQSRATLEKCGVRVTDTLGECAALLFPEVR